jgi:hypothetical protein
MEVLLAKLFVLSNPRDKVDLCHRVVVPARQVYRLAGRYTTTMVDFIPQ